MLLGYKLNLFLLLFIFSENALKNVIAIFIFLSCTSTLDFVPLTFQFLKYFLLNPMEFYLIDPRNFGIFTRHFLLSLSNSIMFRVPSINCPN